MIKSLFILLGMIFLMSSASALFESSISTDSLYVERNSTYPVVLLPLDTNIWDIFLYVNGSAYQFNWSGSQYELSLVFSILGDYPFVINSTNVTGEINGTFLVRDPYYVTFTFYKDRLIDLPFFSNQYSNNFAYVTAEFVGNPALAKNNYNPTLEKYISPLTPYQFKKPVFFGHYTNGQATIKLYESSNYAFRLIDGVISFPYSYSVPNITKSYGTNVYLGVYAMNGSNQDYAIYLSKSDLNPYGSLANWALLALLGVTVLVSGILFFMIPSQPSISISFGLGFSVMLLLIRGVLLIWLGI